MKNTMKKVIAVLFSVVLVAGLLAGCGKTEGGNGSQGTAEGGVLKIGASGPLTGSASSYGISVNKGATLAVKEINAAGGINGMTFEFEMKDDKAEAADAASAYDALMDAGMQISIGSVTSGSCEAFAKRALEDNLFFITPSASAASVIETGDNAFRVCFGDPDQGVLAAQILTEKYETIGCIYDTSDTYSSGIYEAFDAEMKKIGKEYTTCTFDADNKKDFSAQVEALKDCDVICLPIYYQEAGLIARACATKELDNIVLFGCDGLDGVKGEIDETVKNNISYITPFDVNATDELTANFVKNYKAEYDVEPDQFAADGYDAIYILAEILKKAEVKDATISAEDLCELAKAAITDASFSYSGVTGKMTWDKTGAPTKEPVIVEVK